MKISFLQKLLTGQADPPVEKSDETAPSCRYCDNRAEISCVNCLSGSCRASGHIYHMYITKRYGTDADQVGAKFFYYCQSCAGFVCVDCLGLREGYPCDPAALESYPFQCPHCGGSVSVLRCDHASGPEAVEALLAHAAAPVDEAGEYLPYQGHDRQQQTRAGELRYITFGPRSRVMQPQECWVTDLQIERPGAPGISLQVVHRDHPAPATALLLKESGDKAYGRALLPGTVWYDAALSGSPGVEKNTAKHFSLSVDDHGLAIAHLDDQTVITVIKSGIAPIAAFPNLPENGDANAVTAPPASPSDGWAVRILKDLSDKKIWDYETLTVPEADAYGPGASLSLAGSTDLIYYHLVRVFFYGVRYAGLRDYFSHPEFRLASPAETVQLADLATFGERSQAYCITREFGGSFQERAYLVADRVEVRYSNFARDD